MNENDSLQRVTFLYEFKLGHGHRCAIIIQVRYRHLFKVLRLRIVLYVQWTEPVIQ